MDAAATSLGPYAEPRVRLDRGRRPARTKSAGPGPPGTRSAGSGSGASALGAANAATLPMGHSTHPIASTSSLACAAVMTAAEGGDATDGAAQCSVERRGGIRSTCPTTSSMILAWPRKNSSMCVTNTARSSGEKTYQPAKKRGLMEVLVRSRCQIYLLGFVVGFAVVELGEAMHVDDLQEETRYNIT